MAKLKGVEATVFTMGGTSLIGVLTEISVQANVGDEDGSAINEIDEDPEPVSRSRQITGTALVEDVPNFIAACEGVNPVVTFSYNSGGMTYAGSALISQVTHSTRRKALQTESFTLKVKGKPTMTAASGN